MDLMAVIENNLIAFIGIFVLGVSFIIFIFGVRKRIGALKRQYKELLASYDEKNMRYAILETQYANTQELMTKIENEKQMLQTNLNALNQDMSAFKAATVAREEANAEKIRYLEQIKQELSLKFKDISSEVIKSQHDSFSNEQKSTLSLLLNPFSEQLKAFKAEVVAAREEGIKNKSNLDVQLANLLNLNQNLSKDAQNLAEALKGGKKAQGNWGECQLARVLEISGLRKDIDYETQESFTDENKKLYRPDVIIHLPDNRDVIIDSKVSLNDYLVAVNTEDDDERALYLQKNVNCIKAHIDELATKEYQKLLKERSLNYVIMFIPVESAYIAALDTDKFIYDYAYRRNVILATPLSLLPTLRTIQNLWQIDNQNQNVQKIAELGGKIYDKLAAFCDDMKTLERGLNQATNAYSNALTKISGRGGALSTAENMKKLGAKTNKIINLALNDNELLSDESDYDAQKLLENKGEANA